ncbi:hypothetical protein PGT21_036307 [Puccinia graminis f. sp. tritici]|uniref:Integrase core domain-containing protein n=1 Tax=Puccinia graminis f. sp. tritici TaxID=56615 RepID=A0A5B0QQ22_PUCGR|nr:hypothetical protein PGT21_036307 [Puccinia graminis f. sp. tritici]
MSTISTSDYSEVDNSDQSSISSPRSPAEIPPIRTLTVMPDDQLRQVLTCLFLEGRKGPEFIKILHDEYHLKISTRTLARRRAEWSLKASDLPKVSSVPTLLPSILERYLRRLKLKQRENDLANGKVTYNQVVERISHARTVLLANTAGYRRMRQILATSYNLRIPRQIFYDILKDLDPAGMALRLRHGCKRRVFRTFGPNHIWSADGHDKLKRFGITIYGVIDAWSRKILGMYVHVTNNDPRHIGVYYLQIALAAGGIPEMMTTDRGNETGHMAAYHIRLSHQNVENLTIEEATKRMKYTKSTHNQRIESTWSRMMKEHNRPIIHAIFTQIEEGQYDSGDIIQR